MLSRIHELINTHKSFILAGHKNPDGDAVGACFALGMALENMGKTVYVLLESYAAKLNVIPGKHLLWSGGANELQAEVFICLDCADIRRLGAWEELFAKTPFTCCIDHHETNSGFAAVNYLEGGASSTSEMVFRLLDGFVEINKNIASALYAGMVYDTGGFRFNAVNGGTLDIAGRLISVGIEFTHIYNELLHMHTYSAARLLAKVIENSRLAYGGRIIYSRVTTKMIEDAGSANSELDGVAEYLLNTRKAELAALFHETPPVGDIKINFRSRGRGVDKLAVALGGGGHKLAAGCTVRGELDAVAEKVVAMLKMELEAPPQGESGRDE